MALQVALENTVWKEDLRVLRLSGRLDSANVSVLEEAVKNQIQTAPYRWAVDLANVDYVSSAGVSALFNMIYTVEPHQGRLCFFNSSEKLTRVFDLLGILERMTIFQDESGARAGF